MYQGYSWDLSLHSLRTTSKIENLMEVTTLRVASLVCVGTSPTRFLYTTDMWGFPKSRGTFLGVPIIRIIVCWGLHWGSPYLGKLTCTGPAKFLFLHTGAKARDDSPWLRVRVASAPTGNYDGTGVLTRLQARSRTP